MKIVLPKQWGRWLEKAGLRVVGKYSRVWWAKFNMVGHNRRWRINRFGELDVSCLSSDFDRWALSWRAGRPCYGTVTNEKQFVALVKDLLVEARAINEDER